MGERETARRDAGRGGGPGGGAGAKRSSTSAPTGRSASGGTSARVSASDRKSSADGASRSRLFGVRQTTLAPALVIVIGLAITAIVAVQYDRIAAERDLQRFQSLVVQRVVSIEERMALYVGLLRGVAAHFAAVGEVTRGQFAAVVDRLRVEREYPGVQGLGYVALIEPGGEAELEARMRAAGEAGFTVWPDAGTGGPDAMRTSIVFLEPRNERNARAVGFDMASEANRRDALVRARDRGGAAASGRVTLVQEQTEDVQPGFLLYLPVFRGGSVPATIEERRQNLDGWVYAPFRARNLFDRALSVGLGPELGFAVYDGSGAVESELLYSTGDVADAGRLGLRTVEQIVIADRPWTIVLETTPTFERASPRVFTPFIALSGLLVTGLLAFGAVRQARAVEEAQDARLQVEDLNHTLEQRVERRTAQLERARVRLAELNVDLERAVQARTAELTAANEEIQRFAYIVSHDLRAPLVNVMGFTSELETVRADLAAFLAELAEKAPELPIADALASVEQELPEALGFIRASTQKMDRLINAILKLSREGRRVLTPEPVDMGALLDTLRGSLAHQLAERDAEIVVDPLPGIVSDRLALEQIFGNLVENAVKYLVPGRPGLVTISAQTGGSQVRFSITDNGRGIEERDFERIFDLFRRAGRQDVPGEGIGLAHTRALVRRLGGTIEVRSTPDEGSTFTVTLPETLDIAAQETARRQEREEAA